MPMYEFTCPGREHQGDRDFQKVFHTVPKNVIDKCECIQEGCGAVARRRFDKEIPTQAIVGMTPISHASTIPGSPAHTTEMAFGKFKTNPDGTVDKNHRPFDTTGDLDRFMNGANDLGKPKIDQRTGQPLRRSDGSIIRDGAKLVKYGANSTPSRTDARKRSNRRGGEYRLGPVSTGWTTDREAKDF